jgi:hypothetical protein
MRVLAILILTLAVIGITFYLAYRKEARQKPQRHLLVLFALVALLQAGNAYLAYVGGRPPTKAARFEDSFAHLPSFPYDAQYTIFNADADLWNKPDTEDCLTLWTHRGDTWSKRGEHREPKNIVARECSADQFSVATTIRSIWPIADWQQGGLIVFSDLNNYIRLTIASWRPDSSSSQVVGVQAVFQDGSEPFLVKNVTFRTREGQARLAAQGPIENVKLRITRDRRSWQTQYYDPQKFHWIDVASTPFNLHPRFAGMLAFHGDSYGDGRPINLPPRRVDFDAFSIEP